jgi:hypothetical protein
LSVAFVSSDYPTLETVKVSDGGLENVIIYVSSGLLPGVTYTAPTTPIELDQLNCHYCGFEFPTERPTFGLYLQRLQSTAPKAI